MKPLSWPYERGITGVITALGRCRVHVERFPAPGIACRGGRRTVGNSRDFLVGFTCHVNISPSSDELGLQGFDPTPEVIVLLHLGLDLSQGVDHRGVIAPPEFLSDLHE